MSLTDYMSYIGGLFGLWFGTNGKNLIIWQIDTMHMTYISLGVKYNQYIQRNKVHNINLNINLLDYITLSK